MATFRDDSVTLDRAYFDTLVRRANLNATTGPVDKPDAAGLTFLPVLKEEYENLLLVARYYANIKQNLINGGVEEATISLLSQDGSSAKQVEDLQSSSRYRNERLGDGGAPMQSTSQTQAVIQRNTYIPYDSHTGSKLNRNGYGGPHQGGHHNNHIGTPHEWADFDPTSEEFTPPYPVDVSNPMIEEQGFSLVGQQQSPQRPQYARMCRRTISLSNLPDNVTHGDVTEVVRGGVLVDVFLRFAEHVAHVSFLQEDDATRFYEHARKHDIYIKNKRVFVKWADRHFHLAGHVAGKIAGGATRNMIIRRCDPKHTEDSIRDDLEHIHNLIVLKVEFLGGSCYVKTNSIHNAMFARTCMMSRAKYKGSKIEWDVDECAQPLVTKPMPSKTYQQQAPPMQKSSLGLKNRFASLRLDDDDDETDDKFDSSSEMPSTVNVTA